jgi:hypothetical protein
MTRRISPLLLAATIVAFLVLGYITVERAALKQVKRTDFTVYLAAAHAVLDGGERLYDVTNDRGWHYTMPPLFAILMVPLALVPPALASAVWYVVTIGLLVLCLSLIVRLVGRPPGEPALFAVALPLLLCVDPLLDTISRGQLGILMLTCCVAALWLHQRERSFLAGLVVAFAATIKVYSGLLVLYLVYRREWKAVLGCACGFLAFGLLVPSLALGPDLAIRHWVRWFTTVVFPYARTSGEALPFDELQDPTIAKNQSLYGTFHHVANLAGVNTASAEVWIKVSVAAATLLLLVLMVMAWQPAAKPMPLERMWFEWSLPMMLGLLLVPTAWSHYYVLLVFPLAAARAYLREGASPGERRLLRWGILSFALLAILYAVTSLIRPLVERASIWHDLVMIPRSAGMLCWGTLVLGAAIWRLLRTSPVNGGYAEP